MHFFCRKISCSLESPSSEGGGPRTERARWRWDPALVSACRCAAGAQSCLASISSNELLGPNGPRSHSVTSCVHLFCHHQLSSKKFLLSRLEVPCATVIEYICDIEPVIAAKDNDATQKPFLQSGKLGSYFLPPTVQISPRAQAHISWFVSLASHCFNESS